MERRASKRAGNEKRYIYLMPKLVEIEMHILCI
jgi:hypothetical protein